MGLDFADWAETKDRWRYHIAWRSIYCFAEHQERVERLRRTEEFPPRGSCSRLNYEAEAELARRHEEEAKRRRGPWVIHVDVGDEAPSNEWEEEYAEMREYLAKRRRTTDAIEAAQALGRPRLLEGGAA